MSSAGAKSSLLKASSSLALKPAPPKQPPPPPIKNSSGDAPPPKLKRHEIVQQELQRLKSTVVTATAAAADDPEELELHPSEEFEELGSPYSGASLPLPTLRGCQKIATSAPAPSEKKVYKCFFGGKRELRILFLHQQLRVADPEHFDWGSGSVFWWGS